MVCLAILIMMGGMMGVKIYDMVEDSRYHNSVKWLYNEIETVQILTLVLRSEAKIEIDKKSVHVITDEPMLAHRPSISLEGVSKIEWDKKEQKKIVLQFFSNGRVDKTGVLALCHRDEKRFIDLSAPLQIKMVKEYPKPITFPTMKRPKDETHKLSVQTG